MSDSTAMDDPRSQNIIGETWDPQKEIEILKEKLLQREKLSFIGQLTAGILHEIKNPLNFVTNFSRLSIGLLDELKEITDKVSEKLDNDSVNDLTEVLALLNDNISKISENGQRAERIIFNLLAQARENKTAEFTPTDINQMVDEFTKLAYQGMRGQDKQFNISLKTNYDPALGLVRVDAQDLSRVVLNIVNNACYAANEKKKLLHDAFNPELIVTTKRLENSFKISIRDNGMGIPKSVADKIYKPFFTTKPNSEGTGLGLYMSYAIITQIHKGTLEVETKEGEFTEFTITIPLNL